MTTTRTVTHRHIDHTDLTFRFEPIPGQPQERSATGREDFLQEVFSAGVSAVYCNVTDEIVGVEPSPDYGKILQDCLASHWVFVESCISREDVAS